LEELEQSGLTTKRDLCISYRFGPALVASKGEPPDPTNEKKQDRIRARSLVVLLSDALITHCAAIALCRARKTYF
jgi:hypothetical protein